MRPSRTSTLPPPPLSPSIVRSSLFPPRLLKFWNLTVLKNILLKFCWRPNHASCSIRRYRHFYHDRRMVSAHPVPSICLRVIFNTQDVCLDSQHINPITLNIKQWMQVATAEVKRHCSRSKYFCMMTWTESEECKTFQYKSNEDVSWTA